MLEWLETNVRGDIYIYIYICDRRIPARVKDKECKVAVIPSMLYRMETVALTKRHVYDAILEEGHPWWRHLYG